MAETSHSTTHLHDRYLSLSSLDFLLIELVPMAERLALSQQTKTTGSKRDSQPEITTISRILDDEELREAAYHRLEALGYRVGQGLAERFVPFAFLLFFFFCPVEFRRRGGGEQGLLTCGSFSRDRPRFTDSLDVIKFLCKDMWTILFRKQVDNLKTNHRVRLVALRRCFAAWARFNSF